MHLASDLGRTVEELENSITMEEYKRWQVFRSTRPFNTAEVQGALMCYFLSAAAGGKQEVEDFMITKTEEPKEEVKLTGRALDQALKGVYG